jgi:hypothetical protein
MTVLITVTLSVPRINGMAVAGSVDRMPRLSGTTVVDGKPLGFWDGGAVEDGTELKPLKPETVNVGRVILLALHWPANSKVRHESVSQ